MKRGPARLTMDCEICGEPMQVSRQRYVELVAAGEKPRCRKNGCERLCGAKRAGSVRTAERLDTVEFSTVAVEWPGVKRGNGNGALAKLRVKPTGDWRYADCGENG